MWLGSSFFLLSTAIELPWPEKTEDWVQPPYELNWPLHYCWKRLDPAGVLYETSRISPYKQDHRIQCIVSVHNKDCNYNKPHVSERFLAKLYFFPQICLIFILLIAATTAHMLVLQEPVFHWLAIWDNLRRLLSINWWYKCSLVAVERLYTFHDFKADVEKEGVCDLVPRC